MRWPPWHFIISLCQLGPSLVSPEVGPDPVGSRALGGQPGCQTSTTPGLLSSSNSKTGCSNLRDSLQCPRSWPSGWWWGPDCCLRLLSLCDQNLLVPVLTTAWPGLGWGEPSCWGEMGGGGCYRCHCRHTRHNINIRKLSISSNGLKSLFTHLLAGYSVGLKYIKIQIKI